MEREVAWEKYTEEDRCELEELAKKYRLFLSENKTERKCATAALTMAKEAGYVSLEEAIEQKRALKPGDKLWAASHGKAIMLIHIGEAPLVQGVNILGAHIDSPRLDLKQNPLYESNGFALLDTHYYGGIKNYQWVALPLAIHGVVVKTDGAVVPISIGDEEGDPVFCVTDLLIHLASQQMDKKGSKVVEGEDLDVLVGNCAIVEDKAQDEEETAKVSDAPAKVTGVDAQEDAKSDKPKDAVKAHVLRILKEKYDITEEDFMSAELEVVPAGPARELGFDRSMILGYGHDDRICAYTSLVAQLALAKEGAAPRKTAVTILVDKEEIGSVGATGMASMFFENTMAEIMELAGEGGVLALHRGLAASSMLSSDVSAGYDPNYASVFDTKNAAYVGKGLVFNKYTGSRGKSGSNDADAEYMARIRCIMDEAKVSYQTAELGKVDAGGGGTIAYIPAKYGMNVIDSGVAILSMHAPWEVASKADVYEAEKGYEAFLRNA